MKKHSEDEKLQGAEGARFGNGKQGFKKKHNNKQRGHGLDVTICLLEEKLVKPEVPVLEEEPTAHKKRVWEYRMNDLMKTEKQLEGNLRNLFMVLMSLCDSTFKNKIRNMSEYPKLMKRLDSLGLLSII